MESGGVSKSMSSLLNVIDTQRYEVDCFILAPQGIFMDSIPQEINMVSDKRTALFFSEFPKNILSLIKSGYVVDAIFRLIAGFLMLFNKGLGGWMLSRRIYKINKEYDLAIDYNGQHQLYYLVDFIKAKKKISFFHSDYAQWNYYYSMDKKYYSKVDKIFTISEICVISLKKYFPRVESKIELFENISSPTIIHKLSNQEEVTLHENSILSVGHLSKQKGTPLAFKVAKELKAKGIKFKWYFIGKNSNDLDYKALAKEYDIEDKIEFLGILVNPYPYLKATKIVAHLSEFEGRSIALDEAKILEKPIIVTSFSTVLDQFQDKYNATICNFNAVEIANSIEELFNNQELCNKYSSNLSFENIDNTSEIKKLYKLIN